MKITFYKNWLIALAILLLVPVCRWIVLPHLEKIPDNFSYKANIFSVDNFYDETEKRFSGEVLSVTKFSYDVIRKDEDGDLIIKNIFDVKKPSGEKIFAVERLYAINPYTRAHVTGKGDRNRNGFLFSPKNILNKQDFTYWHINYNTPARMKFQGEEIIAGLKVYRYACMYKADQTENLTFLPGVPEERGVELEIALQTWIDPQTGWLIKYEDHTIAWYYNILTRQHLYPWNKFHNEFTQSSILHEVEIAKSKQQLITLVKIYLPIALALIAFLIVLFGWLKTKYKKDFMPAFAALLILVTIAGGSLLFYYLRSNLENEKQLEKFEADAGKALSYIKSELEISKLTLDILRFDYRELDGMPRNRFRQIAQYLLKKSGNIQAFGYTPVVRSDDRKVYEERARKEGHPQFQFTEKNSKGALVKAATHDFYLPVYFIEPYHGNEKALGYNLASDSVRLKTLDLANQTGDPVITEPTTLIQNQDQKISSVIIYNPVFKNNEVSQRKLSGYFSGVYKIDNLINSALSSHDVNQEIKLKIIDLAANKRQLLFSNIDSIPKNSLSITKQLPVLNHAWEFTFYLQPASFNLNTLILLIIGIFLALTLAILAFRVLSDKTKELKESNERFLKAFNNNPIAMIIMNLKTYRFEYANELFLTNFGYTREEVIGKTSDELNLIDPQFQKKTASMLKAGEDVKDAEILVTKKNGETFCSLTSIQVIIIHRKKFALASFHNITERIKMEEALRLNENKFREFLESAPDAIVIANREGDIQIVNIQTETLFGYKREELLGKKVELLIPQRYNKIHPEHRKNYFAQAKIRSMGVGLELYGLKKDGTEFPVEISLSPLETKEGLLVSAAIRDVSERKKIEGALKKETGYVKLLQTIATAANKSDTIEQAAQIALDKICELTTWPIGHLYLNSIAVPDKLMSTGVWHLDDPKKFQTFKKITEAYNFIAGEGLPGRVWLSKKTAWIPDVSVDSNFPRNKLATGILVKAGFAFPITVEKEVVGVLEFFSTEVIDEPDKRLLDVCVNIGELLGRTIERQRNEETLVNKNTQLAEAQEIAHLGSWEWDVNANKIEWSDELYRIYGLKPEEFKANYENYLKIIHPEDREYVDSIVKRALKDHQPFNFFHRIIRADGVVRTISARGNVFTYRNNDVIKICGTLQDVTEIKEAEQELIRQKEKAEEAEKAKEQFLANMSHEIRTPMNAIIGFTRLVEETTLSNEQKEWLTIIKHSGENLLVIINDILDFSKMEAGKLEFETDQINIADLISSTVAMFKPKTEEKNIELSFSVDSKISSGVLGDSIRLTQILLNLLSNAIKFTSKGFVKVNVELINETDKYYTIRFSVIDTGIGIEQDKLNTIFESFSQASGGITRKYGGTGLGLSIAKKLVELQGGSMNVQSKYNEGSDFTFTLSFEKTKLNGQPVDTKMKDANIESVTNLNVLLVEDDPLNQKLAQIVLEKWKINVDTVANGKLAISKLDHKNYDLILMDLQMPEMDGYQTTKHIRDTMHKNIPIIALTAHAMKSEADKCKHAGMNDYISKPFNPKELLSKIIQYTRENSNKFK